MLVGVVRDHVGWKATETTKAVAKTHPNMMTLLSALEIILGINGQLMTPVTKPTWQPLGELKLRQEEEPAKNKAWSEK